MHRDRYVFVLVKRIAPWHKKRLNIITALVYNSQTQNLNLNHIVLVEYANSFANGLKTWLLHRGKQLNLNEKKKKKCGCDQTQMSHHAARQLQPRAYLHRGSWDYLHDKDWWHSSRAVQLKKHYLPQVPMSCVSEHAWYANTLLLSIY